MIHFIVTSIKSIAAATFVLGTQGVHSDLPKLVFALTPAEMDLKLTLKMRNLRSDAPQEFADELERRHWKLTNLNPKLQLAYDPKVVLDGISEKYDNVLSLLDQNNFAKFGQAPDFVKAGVLDMMGTVRSDLPPGTGMPASDLKLWFEGSQSVTFTSGGKTVDLDCAKVNLKPYEDLRGHANFDKKPVDPEVMKTWTNQPLILEDEAVKGVAIETQSTAADSFATVYQLVSDFVCTEQKKNVQLINDKAMALASKLNGGDDLVTLTSGGFNELPAAMKDRLEDSMQHGYSSLGFGSADEAKQWIESAKISVRSFRVICHFATSQDTKYSTLGFEVVPSVRS